MERKYLKRALILISAVLIKICVGSLYSWSVYSHILTSKYSFTSFQSQFIFGLSVLTFTFTMLFAGRLEKKFGPSPVALTGGVFFLLGHILAYFSKGNFLIISFSMGFLNGIAIGCCYVAALVTPIKWFPHHKGLISGITVAGFGLGAVIHSFFVQKLSLANPEIFNIFLVIGLSYSSIIILSSFILAVPEKMIKDSHDKIMLIKELITDKNIIALSIAIFVGTFSGLMIVGNIKFITSYYGSSQVIALLSVTLFSLTNASGRIIWGFFSDKIERKKLIISAILLNSIAMLLLPFFLKNTISSILTILLLGFSFSSNFVLFVSEVSYRYGAHKVGSIYPFIFLFYGFAGVFAPSIGGIIFDITKSYNFAIILAILLALIGAISFNLLYKKSAIK